MSCVRFRLGWVKLDHIGLNCVVREGTEKFGFFFFVDRRVFFFFYWTTVEWKFTTQANRTTGTQRKRKTFNARLQIQISKQATRKSSLLHFLFCFTDLFFTDSVAHRGPDVGRHSCPGRVRIGRSAAQRRGGRDGQSSRLGLWEARAARAHLRRSTADWDRSTSDKYCFVWPLFNWLIYKWQNWLPKRGPNGWSPFYPWTIDVKTEIKIRTNALFSFLFEDWPVFQSNSRIPENDHLHIFSPWFYHLVVFFEVYNQWMIKNEEFKCQWREDFRSSGSTRRKQRLFTSYTSFWGSCSRQKWRAWIIETCY